MNSYSSTTVLSVSSCLLGSVPPTEERKGFPEWAQLHPVPSCISEGKRSQESRCSPLFWTGFRSLFHVGLMDMPSDTNCPFSGIQYGKTSPWCSHPLANTLYPWEHSATVGKEHLRFLQEFCLHTRAEGLPSACANVVLRPGTQRNTFPSSSATGEDKVLEPQPSAMLQTQSFSHAELGARGLHCLSCPGL